MSDQYFIMNIRFFHQDFVMNGRDFYDDKSRFS